MMDRFAVRGRRPRLVGRLGFRHRPFDRDAAETDYAIPAAVYNNIGAESDTFGSAHSGGIHAVFGDNSVHTISYDIDRNVFNFLGNRVDGQVVDASQWVN